uniref:Uncharacterized protein n=1 Tax=Ackermannviridae sp. TaxID=2831612 RepID=A0A8S5VXH3_9CAUD|nr:MAG TPA: hypothetical protein [Ackermannviridae sp.]
MQTFATDKTYFVTRIMRLWCAIFTRTRFHAIWQC